MQTTSFLFTPPSGLVRSIPRENTLEYAAKFKQLGPFKRHMYDLDICTLYRQIDDLRGRYENFAGQPYDVYANHIRLTTGSTLQKSNLDPDFYLNHFYFALKPGNSHYLAFQGIFLAMSDPSIVIPILEYQLKEVFRNQNLKVEDFLGELEYTSCNFIRTNRFPEDWFYKHEKIINWIYSKRDALRSEVLLSQKFDNLIKVLSAIAPKKISVTSLNDLKPAAETEPILQVKVIEEKRRILFEDIKDRFGENTHATLYDILAGKAEESLKILFNGNANQLIDVFRIYVMESFIAFDKRTVAKWICDHFMFIDRTDNLAKPFEIGTTEAVIYKQRLPTKDKRIELSGLPKAQSKYYPIPKKLVKTHVQTDLV